MLSQACDRTAELKSLAQTFRARRNGDPGPESGTAAAAEARRRAKRSSPSQFSAAAAEISRRVQLAAGRLQELARLVKSSQMFADMTVRINKLSLAIKQDVTGLKVDIDKLSEQVGRGRTLTGGGQDSLHSQHMVHSLKMRLGETTKTFANVLQTRADKLREEQDRRERLGYADSSASVLDRPLAFGSGNGGGLPPRPNSQGKNNLQRAGMAVNNGMGSDAAGSDGLRGEIAGASPLGLSESQLVSRSTDYYETRANAVQTINQTMGDLNSMFSELLRLIDIQGSNVQRIDENVNSIEADLEVSEAPDPLRLIYFLCPYPFLLSYKLAYKILLLLSCAQSGLQEMQRAAGSRGNFMLFAKMFGIFVVFLVLFIFFLA